MAAPSQLLRPLIFVYQVQEQSQAFQKRQIILLPSHDFSN